MSWLLDNTEAEFVELLKKAGEEKHPLPVGEAMVEDPHTKAWFEATSHVICIRVSRPLISLISYALRFLWSHKPYDLARSLISHAL